MADEKLPVETVIVATETGGSDQKRLGTPMVMLMVLIGLALAAIGITVFVLSK